MDEGATIVLGECVVVVQGRKSGERKIDERTKESIATRLGGG